MAECHRSAALPAAGLLLLFSSTALAHSIGIHDADHVAASSGFRPMLFAYLGAKHMLTGLDHLLFLLAIIFVLRRLADVWRYATWFALGHSLTLVAGVMWSWPVNEHAVDAMIGLSIVYKALDNLHAFETLISWRPAPQAMVALFGLIHGLGLAARMQGIALAPEGLLGNLLSFNLGVEVGQLLALALFLCVGSAVLAARRPAGSLWSATAVNFGLLSAGCLLTFEQLSAMAFSA